eukprot:2389631-Amphidinium_carterae.1
MENRQVQLSSGWSPKKEKYCLAPFGACLGPDVAALWAYECGAQKQVWVNCERGGVDRVGSWRSGGLSPE